MKILPVSILFAFVASSLAANQISVARSYTYAIENHIKKDIACVAAFKDKVAPNFRGLNGIELSANSISETTYGSLAIYTDVKFKSLYGDSSGSLNCSFASKSDTVIDIGVTFVGSGLGGFESRGRTSPSSDPSDWKVMSFSTQIRP